MWDNVLGRSPGPINPSTLSLTLLLRALASECGGGTTRIAAPPPGGAPHPAIYSLILLPAYPFSRRGGRFALSRSDRGQSGFDSDNAVEILLGNTDELN